MTSVPSITSSIFQHLPSDLDYSDRESLLKSVRNRVLLEAHTHLNSEIQTSEESEPKDVSVIQLQARLNEVMYRVRRKERVRDGLRGEWEAMRAQQEGMFALEEAKRVSGFAPPSDRTSQSEFSCTYLWDRKSRLDSQLSSLQSKLHCESLLCDQMTALLHKTKAATMSSRQKSDQLRYLQRRLFKRHDEIVTLHARADNESLHAHYSVVKTTALNAEEKGKRVALLNLKKREIDSLRIDVNLVGESIARKVVQGQSAKVQCYLRFLSGEPIVDQQIDVREIVHSFDRLQFQSASLNKRFTGLAQQENELRKLCSELHEELGALIEQQASVPLHHLSRRESAEVTSQSQIMDLLGREDEDKCGEKLAAKYESFCGTLILNCQETLLRQFSCLTFIASYAGGHPEQVSESLGALSEKEVVLLDRPSKPPSKVTSPIRRSPTRRQNNVFFPNEEVLESVREDEVVTFPLSKLREELSNRLPYRSEVVDIVMTHGAEMLPVRLFSELLSASDWGRRVERVKGEYDDQALAVSILTILVQEGNTSIQRKAEDLISAMRQLYLLVSAGYCEVTQLIASAQLNTDQAARAETEQQRLFINSEGPFLKNIPVSLRHRLRGAFDGRVKRLALSQCRSGSVDDESRGTGREERRHVSSIDVPMREDNQVDQDFEKDEFAMILRERRIKKTGAVASEKGGKKDTFISEKISNLSAIRRSADLEKKLLEQVQGIEFKLQRVKSRGIH